MSDDADEVDELDYLEETGPGIPELPAGDAEHQRYSAGGEPVPVLPGWEVETIQTFLQGTGAGIHMLIGQTDNDWLMTRKDLERIAPPLTRICNRWEPALRLSPIADPLLVAHGFALYGWRSALEAKRAQRDQEAEAEAGPGYQPAAPDVNGSAASESEPDLELGDEPQPYFPNARRPEP